MRQLGTLGWCTQAHLGLNLPDSAGYFSRLADSGTRQTAATAQPKKRNRHLILRGFLATATIGPKTVTARVSPSNTDLRHSSLHFVQQLVS
ncbi:hypothetical protein LMH87_002255 [Akanthomyces muscarius]|uniref:Uncharacterized protein n=1 Tax=Akanthomyces muscarius TaxID=2231603 RepID=A0A9W8Q6G6_AKAMU|nr:hypothetical protein LMH87_002255 [Akanthomyces muscarius]KAJ4147749.1 hypothetical protein LMH87_002255 [Akanthomyces muscarius]